MSLIDQIVARAKSNRQRIVLPESFEERTITAADRAIADGLADIILIGNREKVLAYAAQLGLKHIDQATIIDPETSDKTEEYAQLLFQLRQKKGMTICTCRRVRHSPISYHERCQQTTAPHLRQADGVLPHLGTDAGRYS